MYFYSEKEGIGKTGFFNWLIDEVISDNYCVMCDMNKVLSKFNSTLDKNLLCVFNETKEFGEEYTENDKLKSIISDYKLIIENKGLDCRKITNNSKQIILSNNINSVKIKKNDRRYCVLELNNTYACNKTYFNQFYKIDLNQTSACAFYNYLMNIDIDGWDHEKMPITNIKIEIMRSNRNYVEKFLFDLYNNEYEHDLLELNNDKTISSSTLYMIFIDWHKKNGLPKPLSSHSFVNRLYEIIPRQKVNYNNKRVNRVIINKKIIENALNK